MGEGVRLLLEAVLLEGEGEGSRPAALIKSRREGGEDDGDDDEAEEAKEEEEEDGDE